MSRPGPEYELAYVDRGRDRLALHVYPDPPAAGAPVVVLWPAMGVPARYYRPFAADLLAHGLGVVVVDLRGTGDSTPRPDRSSEYGYRELAGDVGAVLDALGPRLNGRRPLLAGHSLGGQACLLHLALTGNTGVAGLVLIAVALPYWRAYPGRRPLVVLPYTQAIGGAATLLRVWPGWGFGGRQARGVIRDWAYTARTGRFPKLGLSGPDGADPEAALRRLTTPVLAVSVEHDRYTPVPVMDHLCAKLTAAPVTRVHYAVGEAGGPLDHFRWVRAGAPLAIRIADFAAGRSRRS